MDRKNVFFSQILPVCWLFQLLSQTFKYYPGTKMLFSSFCANFQILNPAKIKGFKGTFKQFIKTGFNVSLTLRYYS